MLRSGKKDSRSRSPWSWRGPWPPAAGVGKGLLTPASRSRSPSGSASAEPTASIPACSPSISAKYIAGNPTIVVQVDARRRRHQGDELRRQRHARRRAETCSCRSTRVCSRSFCSRARSSTTFASSFRLGTANQTNVIVVVREDTGIKKWQDLRGKQVVMGSTGRGSTGYLIPFAVNGMLGTKMKIISGYKGSSKTGLAVERNEVNGRRLQLAVSGSPSTSAGSRMTTASPRAVLQVGPLQIQGPRSAERPDAG